jgi:AraC-like DNA-binding protein
VNETRFEIAHQLLHDTQSPLAQIAALGYSEASAFTRAFRRWSG